MKKFYFLYNDEVPVHKISEILQVAPDFAASVSNHLCSLGTIPYHPLAWSRFASDRDFFNFVLGSRSESWDGKFLKDSCKFNELIDYKMFKVQGCRPVENEGFEIDFSRVSNLSWNFVEENLSKIQEVFKAQPFFKLRLGWVETDDYFLKADGEFLWPASDYILKAQKPEEAEEYSIEQQEGLLGAMGYRVGERGESEEERYMILAMVYYLDPVRFPKQFPGEYRARWGLPGSSKRLQRIAESITFFLRAYVGKHGARGDAFDDWSNDLDWLKRNFYEGGYSFDWPGSKSTE